MISPKKSRPTKRQFKTIKARFLKKTGIKIIRSDRWYTRLFRRPLLEAAESQLIGSGIDAKRFLNERVIAIHFAGETFVLSPRPINHRRPIRNLCLLTHEQHHSNQEAEGPMAYRQKYLIQDGRAEIEAEAYASEEPVRNFFGYSKADRRFGTAWGEIYFLNDLNRESANMRYSALITANFCPAATRTMMSIIKKVMT